MIVIPYPPPQLMPNRKNGKHWGATVKIKDKYYSDCYYMTIKSGVKIKNKKTATTIIIYPPNDIRRDIDNLLSSMKSGIDGISKALGVDDRYFRPITIDIAAADKNNPRVEIFFKSK